MIKIGDKLYNKPFCLYKGANKIQCSWFENNNFKNVLYIGVGGLGGCNKMIEQGWKRKGHEPVVKKKLKLKPNLYKIVYYTSFLKEKDLPIHWKTLKEVSKHEIEVTLKYYIRAKINNKDKFNVEFKGII